MRRLFDSDSFVVVQMQTQALSDEGVSAAAQLQGYEIVDKRSGKEVFLNGTWAESFNLQVEQWKETIPTRQEVEFILDSYAGLAQHPVVVH